MKSETQSPDILIYTEAPDTGGVTHVIDMLTKSANQEWLVMLVCKGNRQLRTWENAVAARGVIVKTFALRGKLDITNWFDIPNIIKVVREARRARLFHCHLHTPFSCSAAITIVGIFTGTPIIVTEHYITQIGHLRRRKLNPAMAALREVKIRFLLWTKRISLKFVYRVITVSASNREYMTRTFGKSISEKTEVIRNGIEIDRYSASEYETGTVRISGEFRVVTIAGLNNQKGHEYLFRAIVDILPRFPAAKFLLVGDGHLRRYLEAMTFELGISNAVQFMGFRSDVQSILRSADIFVLPSLFEGLPLSLLEAMAAGKPVVATDVDGTHDVVIDGATGFLVPPKDPAALSQRIAELLADSRMRERFGQAGKERVFASFSDSRMTREYSELYESALA